MLPFNDIAVIRKALDSSQNPLFFFHDDPDGLASFLILYRYVRRGRGFPVKAKPVITSAFAHKVVETVADRVFVLDIAEVDQNFIDSVSVPIFWIDHHIPLNRSNVVYVNPRVSLKENIPTPALCYEFVNRDLWIAIVGCISEWYIPPFIDLAKKQFPDLFGSAKTIEELLFHSPIGILSQVFSFNLKGESKDVYSSIRIFTRIEHPDEILKQTTSQGKFLWRRYLEVKQRYDVMRERALRTPVTGKLLVFTYSSDNWSLTKDLANELIALNPDKLVVLGREKSGEMRCSIRSGKNIFLPDILAVALKGLNATGGGHEHACGAAVPVAEFPLFLERLEAEVLKY